MGKTRRDFEKTAADGIRAPEQVDAGGDFWRVGRTFGLGVPLVVGQQDTLGDDQVGQGKE